MDRRTFLTGCTAGLSALMLAPGATLTRTSHPGWLTGYATPGRTYGVGLIRADLTFTPFLQSTERLHGIIAHPHRDHFCAPARRPGKTFAVIRGQNDALQIKAPDNRHYYGHGVYTANGETLLLTENDLDNERGVIGIYDPKDHYKRVSEIPSGGIGPHEIIMHPDGKHIIVANGGILTHPSSGRAKLNLDTMLPSITIVEHQSGKIIDKMMLPADQHQLSLRHLDITSTGVIIYGAQAQSPRTSAMALAGKWWPGSAPILFRPPPDGWSSMKGYVGSVSIDRSGSIAAAASPRGNVVHFWNISSGECISSITLDDVCGLSSTEHPHHFLLTTGQGKLFNVAYEHNKLKVLKTADTSFLFDNHCRRNA